MSARILVVLAASALTGLAAWPAFVTTREAQASAAPTPAPVVADYAQRDRLVAFYEDAVRRHPDQIVTRMLASQYLQRFRENGDAGDVMRGEHAARASLALQPRFNAGGEMALASSLVSLHRFREALAHAERALEIEPGNTAAVAQAASTQVELGRYDDARRLLTSGSAAAGGDGTRAGDAATGTDVALGTARARYDEVTGHLAQARRSIDLALVQTDSIIDSPAESRAWFHFRAGELAWVAGDAGTAERRFREALVIFPGYARALNGLARLYWAQRRWPDALDAATRAAQRVPLPETLGYEADAQRALGDEAAARGTEDLITAIARIGGAAAINDRALAISFAEHGRRLDDAVAIARRDVAARDDVFAEDTLAWALARSGHWTEARSAARKAVRWNTQDARLQYHAGVIAMECGDRGEAARRLHLALELNPAFHPVYADDARARLGRL
jgi:tetratricopeptide (TPR) repeat protein